MDFGRCSSNNKYSQSSDRYKCWTLDWSVKNAKIIFE